MELSAGAAVGAVMSENPTRVEDALTAAQRAKIRRLSAPAEHQAGDEGGELNVVPYLDIIMNVMMFVLVSVSVAFTTTIGTSAARAAPGPVAPGLHLTALITGQGVALKIAGGSLAPGCEQVGPGLTVPNVGASYDLTALTACARRIKSQPGVEQETQVTVTASPNIPYDAVIGVMDALRADETGPLFPEVTLGAVR